jgi:hypothetical protein
MLRTLFIGLSQDVGLGYHDSWTATQLGSHDSVDSRLWLAAGWQQQQGFYILYWAFSFGLKHRAGERLMGQTNGANRLSVLTG